MSEFIIKAPAKINIGLNIINKREDGYHNLETIFYPINLFDCITIKQSTSYKFSTDSDFLSGEGDNLITKAVRLIEEFTNKEIAIDIHLEKRIPIGAGLGGGSSDGAAVLKGVNEFLKLGIPEKELMKMALKLGSDVPFFIKSKPAYATSRGEILIGIDLRIPQPILLVNPGIHISTKWAFENITPSGITSRLYNTVGNLNDVTTFKDLITNDFEPVCTSNFKDLKNIKEQLYNFGAKFAIMTGSGSTFFGIFPDIKSAEDAQAYFKANNYFTFIHLEHSLL